MSFGVCKNPSCKSFGTAHPNCKCYGGMAGGGEVHHCNGPHQSDCEYFMSGGPVGELTGVDPNHAVAGHMAHDGILGMLRMHEKPDLDRYHHSVRRGHKNIDNDAEQIFSDKKISRSEDRKKFHELIDKWIENGGIGNDIQRQVHIQNSPQSFAAGGAVDKLPSGVLHGHPIEHMYPEQNVLINAAKGRVSNYLSALRPQKYQPKLAFDDSPDTGPQKKMYDRAVKIADRPTQVIHELSHGKLEAEQMLHLKGMYPELLDSMQKKMTEKIIKAQLEGRKPDRKTRQAMSLFMGAALSSEFTPGNIQAAQAVFAKQPNGPAQSQPGGTPAASKPKHSESALTNSDKSFLTGSQALISRQQRRT